MTDGGWFERFISEALKCSEKFQLTKLTVPQPDSPIYCLGVIVFERLKNTYVQWLGEVSRMSW